MPILDDDSDDGIVATLPAPAPSRAGKPRYSPETDSDVVVSRKHARLQHAVSPDDESEPEENESAPVAAAEEEEEEEFDELGEDEYIVEKILGHVVEKGVPKFQVKWDGYDDPSDITWEPEDTLRAGAEDVLEAYLATQGGLANIIASSTAVLTSKKRTRKSAAPSTPPSDPVTKRSRRSHPLDTAPPKALREMEWTPPSGSWEEEIEKVNVRREEDDEGKSVLKVYLKWKNGKKTKHTTELVYKRCPQLMLRFYESLIKPGKALAGHKEY